MSSDTLQQILTVGPLAAGQQVVIPHALACNGIALVPTLIWPDTPTPIGVVAASKSAVTFRNTGLAAPTATFLVQFTHSFQQAPSTSPAPLCWRGVAGVAGDVEPTFTSENKDVVPLALGQPVAVHPSGTGVVRASSTSPSLLTVGLVAMAIPVGLSGPVQASGPMTLPDWSAVTGTMSLAIGATYYLDAVLGQMAVGPPSSGYVQIIGRPVAPQTLLVAPSQVTRL
jgi:hypothetical protein